MLNKNTESFIGCNSEYFPSDIVIFGAPFDGTTSFRPGARFGPHAIRSESFGIETFSAYQDRDLCEIKVFDAGDIELPFGDAARALTMVGDMTAQILNDDKIPIMLGGEHLMSLGVIRELVKVYPDLCIVHFDAHTDLREQYLGESLSHSAVMRRVWELLGDGKIFQFGIRSGEREEFDFASEHNYIERFSANTIPKIVPFLSDKPVYISLDLDVLDPSLMSGTGTPEAGGLSFMELIIALAHLQGTSIVGADIVELAPHYDQSGTSTATACKLLREILLML